MLEKATAVEREMEDGLQTLLRRQEQTLAGLREHHPLEMTIETDSYRKQVSVSECFQPRYVFLHSL